MSETLLSISNLSVSYPIQGGLLGRKVGEVRAVNDVNFRIQKGEVLGLVGESGCGKSTLGKAILRLLEPSQGEIHFKGTALSGMRGGELRKWRRSIQMIFQDPYSSLNPRMTVGQTLGEPLLIHKLCPRSEIRSRVLKLLQRVGLRPESIDRYPHEFSGGQRQRIGIARALAVEPEFIVADEPVSALDVSIQAQILNLLKGLQQELGLTMLFISHDLNVIRYLCDRVVVMYLGRVMEILSRDELVDPHFPKHPYTQALLASAPRKHPSEHRDHVPLSGDIPSPARPPAGCVFHTRCPEVQGACRVDIPILRRRPTPSRSEVACFQRDTDRTS